MRLVTENQLDEWARTTRSEAQQTVVELLARLVRQAAPDAARRRVPLGDSLNQPGADMVLEVAEAVGPYIPEGLSFWEIGTGRKPGDKATKDYRELTAALSREERSHLTFVFVTPMSGVREHEDTWSPEQQVRWVANRHKLGDWDGVRVLDGTQLVDWLTGYPLIEAWLARKMGLTRGQFEGVESRWAIVRTVGSPGLSPEVFLVGRQEASQLVGQALELEQTVVQLETHYPEEVPYFVAACVEALPEEKRQDVRDRTAIVSDVEALGVFIELDRPHVIVVDFDTSLSVEAVRMSVERARHNGHALIMAASRGGTPRPDRTRLVEPGVHGLEQALSESGFDAERARILAAESDGSIVALLNALMMHPAVPEWATGDHARDLAVAQLAGAWDEATPGDQDAFGMVCGSSWGNAIGALRRLVNRPGTPLRHAGSKWRVSPRYEAWTMLGVHLFDNDLDRLRDSAIEVLGSPDPRFELPKDERFMASVKGKVAAYSYLLRSGMADTLALLGSCPAPLENCTPGKAASVAHRVVCELLQDDDWRRWAGLHEHLPLLAEAAPDAFLDAVDRALGSDAAPFAEIFAQEGDGITGTNYMSGLLWALETLAWEPRWLPTVLVALGKLAEIDPGGHWANRPDRSMANILLPWHRQTIASVEQRASAVRVVARECPAACWRMLLQVLPESHQTTMGSRKPAWRHAIPEEWTPVVTTVDYLDEVEALLVVAMKLAIESTERMAELVPKLDDLPKESRARVLELFSSDQVVGRPEEDRDILWQALDKLARRHRKYSHTDWALEADQVEAMEAVRDLLAPTSPSLSYAPLFSERQHDLMDGDDDYEAQFERLEAKRRQAASEILDVDGVEGIFRMSATVDSPWRLGFSFGATATEQHDLEVLPDRLSSQQAAEQQMVAGYVRGRHHALGWDWFDGMSISSWKEEQIGLVLGMLPLSSDGWVRAESHLPDVAHYWSAAGDNPYELRSDRNYAAAAFVRFGRPWTAIELLSSALHDSQDIDVAVAVDALKSAVTAPPTRGHDLYAALRVIEALQSNPAVPQEDLITIEWAYLTALDGSHGEQRPKTINRALATQPSFFCEAIRLGFLPEGVDRSQRPKPTEEEARVAENAWRLLYGWKDIPGLQDDETVDAAELDAWWSEVSRSCSESGHLGVATDRLGHSMSFAPADPDGLWLSRSVAAFLDRDDMSDARDGFSVGLFNARGVHGFTSGRAEAEIATDYEAKAESLRVEGFHRIADTVSSIADAYRTDSEREARRHDREW